MNAIPLTSINGVPVATLPDRLDKLCDQWLTANQKERAQVLHGLFPFGMVQRWIERAEQAEATIRNKTPLPTPEEMANWAPLPGGTTVND